MAKIGRRSEISLPKNFTVGENTNPFQIGRGLKGKLIDVAPSAKADPTEGGKRKIVSCHWKRILGDSAMNASSFWCNR